MDPVTTRPDDPAPDAAGEGRTAREAVRSYLLFLSNPQLLVDTATAERLRAQLAATTDPLDRLKVLSQLEAVETVDTAALTAGFIAHAAAYAATEQVTAGAFAAFGVPAEVLAAAGFDTAALPPPPRRRVSRDQVADIAGTLTGPFTVKELISATGANPHTVRRAVTDLLTQNLIVECGPDPRHTGPGPAPKQYRRRPGGH